MKIGDMVFVRGYIDEIRKDTVIIRNNGGYFGTVPDEIVSSVQPEIEQIKWERDTAIQQLKDLGYGLGEKPRTDGDCISRQTAIDLWDKYHPYIATKAMEYDRDLRALPPVQPDIARDIATIIENEKDMRVILSGAERKKGEWAPTYSDCGDDVWVVWKCSECGYVRKKGWDHTSDGERPDALFCEMCNADMRGEQNE